MAEEKKSNPTQETPSEKEQSQEVKLNEIHILPGFMVRKRIDKELGGLVQSIKGQGVMEPVVLRPRVEGGYQMVSGYRRMWAAEMAGKGAIPAIIHDMTLEEARQYARESNGTQKPPIPGKPVPSKEAPTADKAPEGKAPTAEKPTAPGKEATAAPTADKTAVVKAPTAEKPATPDKEATARPTADKAAEGKAPTAEKPATPDKEATARPTAGKAAEGKTPTAEKPTAPNKEATAVPTADKTAVVKAPTAEKPAAPAKEATAAPPADKTAVVKAPTAEKPAAPGKEATAAPNADKTPEGKTAPNEEKSATNKKPTAPDTPPADKPLEPGETGKVPLSLVCVPKNKDEFRVNPFGPLFTATAETLMDEQDVYKPLQVKKNKSGLYELTDPRDAMLLAAASSLHLPQITIQVQAAKAKDRAAEQSVEEKMMRVPLAELHAFSQHKWRVQDNTPSMLELTASIREMGVTEPVIVRADPKGGYEVLSGHRRLRASQLAKQPDIPIIVRNYDDDEAAIIVADGNLHRDGEEISLMERAFNLRMKYDARQRKMGRKAEGEAVTGRGDTDFAKSEGLSRTKLHQLMRLTELIPQLQDMVTEGTKLKSFNTIYELACLKPAEQTMVYAQIKQSSRVPTLEEVKALRRGEDPTKPKAPPTPEAPTPEQPTATPPTPVPPAPEPSAPPSQEPPSAPEVAPSVQSPAFRQSTEIQPPPPADHAEPPWESEEPGEEVEHPVYVSETHTLPFPDPAPTPAPPGQIPPNATNIMDFLPPKQADTPTPGQATPSEPPMPGPSQSPEPDAPPEAGKDPDSAYNILIPGPVALSWFGRDMTPLDMKRRVMDICIRAVSREKEMKAQAQQEKHPVKKALPPPKRPQGPVR